MLQATQNKPVLTVSPPESGFSPRREFVRDSHVPSTFALLAIAGTGFVRLSSFSQDLVSTLRYALESQSLLRTIREEPNLHLVEFTLDGKPWTQRKSPESEKLFVQILAIIFRHGYRFLSTIDYGRESSERVSIAFSRLATLSAFEAARVPFALSFPSSRVLRVINPPLNSTPAILQAARSAWPRGVVSEKKVSNNCYEFRLKGYRWFQEDTFSRDSMQHILTLLNALDRYAFTLLTSISLTGNHSRVKDMWIFSGSPMEPSSDPAASSSNIELSRGLTPPVPKNAFTPVWTSSSRGNYSADTLHGKGGSLPGSSQGSSHTLGHIRSATDPNASGIARSSSVLRKKSPPNPLRSPPLGQPRLSRSSEEFPLRRNNLSTIGSVDMTGIGSTNQRNFATEVARGDAQSPSSRDFPRASTSTESSPDIRDSLPERARVQTGELFYETGPSVERNHPQSPHPEDMSGEVRTSRSRSPGDSGSESRHSSKQWSPHNSSDPPHDVPQNVSDRVTSDVGSLTPPILGSKVFRDSAFSSSSTRSCEIPIAWTGGPEGEKGRDSELVSHKRMTLEPDVSLPETDEGYGGSTESGLASVKRSSTPKFPGTWQPTPITELPEDQGGLTSPESDEKLDSVSEGSPERKEVDAERVASPMLSNTPGATRKSEVALYGMVNKPAQLTMEPKRRSSNPPASPTTKSNGWVLVSVADDVTDNHASNLSGARPKSPPAARSSTDVRSRSSQSGGSPLVKAIAVEDARKHGHSKSQSTSGLKRFFSGAKSKSRQSPGAVATSSDDATGRARTMSLREKWRKKTSL